jgi:phosphoribosylformylglycinamidine synthase
LKRILAHPTVASKEWIVRQYDHEVQGGSAIKPLVGPHEGPGDAAVIAPVLGSWPAWPSAVECGRVWAILTRGRWRPVRLTKRCANVVAVGANPRRVAILDNFCWGNTDRPEVLGSLVLAALRLSRGGVGLSHTFHQRQGQSEERVQRRQGVGS